MSKTTMTRNLEKVFRESNSELLSRETYNFITLHMGFIAHFDRSGFASVYGDVAKLAIRLRCSEYSNDPEYNQRWAEELDQRGEPENASKVRALLGVAECWTARLIERSRTQQAEREIAEATALAERHGFRLVREEVAS